MAHCKQARQQEEGIKAKIVDGYRRGVCDSEGHTLEGSSRGQAGKGSRFMWKPGPGWYAYWDRKEQEKGSAS